MTIAAQVVQGRKPHSMNRMQLLTDWNAARRSVMDDQSQVTSWTLGSRPSHVLSCALNHVALRCHEIPLDSVVTTIRVLMVPPDLPLPSKQNSS